MHLALFPDDAAVEEDLFRVIAGVQVGVEVGTRRCRCPVGAPAGVGQEDPAGGDLVEEAPEARAKQRSGPHLPLPLSLSQPSLNPSTPHRAEEAAAPRRGRSYLGAER